MNTRRVTLTRMGDVSAGQRIAVRLGKVPVRDIIEPVKHGGDHDYVSYFLGSGNCCIGAALFLVLNVLAIRRAYIRRFCGGGDSWLGQ